MPNAGTMHFETSHFYDVTTSGAMREAADFLGEIERRGAYVAGVDVDTLGDTKWVSVRVRLETDEEASAVLNADTQRSDRL